MTNVKNATILYANKWLSLCSVPHREGDYVFSHETRCQGRIVAVLPYRRVNGKYQYLLKSEVTPCWGDEPVVSAITGGYEGGVIEDDAIRELWEEAGYEALRSELIPLGTCRASKSSDTIYSLFAVDVTNKTAVEPQGDGTRDESLYPTVWMDALDVMAKIEDAQVHVMINRLAWHLIH